MTNIVSYRQELVKSCTESLPVTTKRLREIVFLGTGTSSSLPNIFCIARPTDPPCKVCFSSLENPRSKNRRRNTSILVRFSANASSVNRQLGKELFPPLPIQNDSNNPEVTILRLDEMNTIRKNSSQFKSKELTKNGEYINNIDPVILNRNVVIDCGKTFYESCIEWFLLYEYIQLDAVLLTHAHADAILGLDDLRHWTMHQVIQKHVDVYCDSETFKAIEGIFPYLVDTRKATGGGSVSNLNFHTFEHQDKLTIDDFCFFPLPVEHGFVGEKFHEIHPFMSLGYRFENVGYISDVSSIPEDTMKLLEGVQILILDSLHPIGNYTSHFCLNDAIKIVKKLKPSFVYLTDLGHLWDHDCGNAHLEQLCNTDDELFGIRIQLAYDGLRLSFDCQSIS